MQLASGNPSGRAEWNFRCCFALELPNVYDDIKVALPTAFLTTCWDCNDLAQASPTERAISQLTRPIYQTIITALLLPACVRIQ